MTRILELSLAFLTFLLAPKLAVAFSSFTFKDYTLPSYPYHGLRTQDWMACITGCTQEANCLSYSFEYAKEDGRCEFHNCGLDERFELEKQLVYSHGFVFQQVKQAKVFICLFFLCLTIKRYIIQRFRQ